MSIASSISDAPKRAYVLLNAAKRRLFDVLELTALTGPPDQERAKRGAILMEVQNEQPISPLAPRSNVGG